MIWVIGGKNIQFDLEMLKDTDPPTFRTIYPCIFSQSSHSLRMHPVTVGLPSEKKKRIHLIKEIFFFPFFLQAARYIIWMIGFCKASKRDPYFSTSHFGAVNKSWDQVSLFFLAAESLWNRSGRTYSTLSGIQLDNNSPIFETKKKRT